MPLLFIIGVILWIWAEIAAFIAIGGEFGVILTIIGIFVTALIGMWLLRTQGRAVMASLQGQVSRGEAPVAYVTLNADARATGEELRDWLNARVGKHERADEVVIRADLPKTMIGKLDRKALRAEVLG